MPAREVREQIAVARHRVDGLGARDERADDGRPVDLVRPEHRERIGVATFDDRVDRVRRAGLPRIGAMSIISVRLGSARQMSRAYSRIARSAENQPIRAVLRIAFRHHAPRSSQSAPTVRCVAR